MCLIVFAWRPDSDYPLLLAANRDEFHSRPSAPLHWWNDAPEILPGRDLQAGGTWLGVSRGGRFAAVTNIRDPGQSAHAAPCSRGDLTRGFLAGAVPAQRYLATVAAKVGDYQGFNLLLSDGAQLWYLHGSRAQPAAPRALASGIYGLSNAALNVPWPKVTLARQRLAGQLARGTPSSDLLRACVADRGLASEEALRGIGQEGPMARPLSAQFIVTPEYGTRSRCTLRVHRDGGVEMTEQRFDAGGELVGEDSASFRRRSPHRPH